MQAQGLRQGRQAPAGAGSGARGRPVRRSLLRVRADAAPPPPGSEPAPRRPAPGSHAGQADMYRLLNGGRQRAGAEWGKGWEALLPAGGIMRGAASSAQ